MSKRLQADLALGAWDPSSDGLMIAFLNFRSHLAIEAIEPENARHDEVLFPQEFLRRLHRPATLEHRPGRHTVANLVRDPELSRRRLETAFL